MRAKLQTPNTTQLKQTALLLAFTLGEDGFRFNTQPLIDQIRTLKDRYQAIQLRSIESVCRQILQDEVYQPISIQSEKEYRSLIAPYGLDRHDASSSEPLLIEEMEPMSPTIGGRKVNKGRTLVTNIAVKGEDRAQLICCRHFLNLRVLRSGIHVHLPFQLLCHIYRWRYIAWF